MNNKRNYYFDILRIIAMLMIIIHHITINDFGLQSYLNGTGVILSSKQALILMTINSFVIIGVNLFFLVSGYFKIKFNFKKLISLILEVYIIFDIVTFIGILLNFVPLNKETILNLLFPFNQYWFLIVYLVLMIISSYLNKLIEYINKDDKKIIIFLLLLFTIYAYKFDNGLIINGGYSLIWAITMYITGGLINKFEIKNKKGIFLYVISALILTLLAYCLYKFINPKLAWDIYKYNNILIFIESIGLFIWINSWEFNLENKKTIKFITFLATNTLMVYLLHSTCWLTILRKIPIIKLLNIGQFKLGILILPIYAFIIYIICSLISILYNVSIQKLINKIFKYKKVE